MVIRDLIPSSAVLAASALLLPGRPSPAAEARLDCALRSIVEANELGGPEAAIEAARSRRLRLVEKGGAILVPVILEPRAGGGWAIDAAKVGDLGCEVDAVSRSYMRVLAKPSAVGLLTAHPDVRLVRVPFRAKALQTGLGDYVSESVDLIGASRAQELGVTGAGVKVAVVDLGFEDLEQAISLGELPPDTVMVDLPGLLDDLVIEHTRHGVGVAEQVADVAPGARIYCMKTVDEVDLQNAANYIAAYGIRVGVHALGWTNASYYDGTGPVSAVFNDSRAMDDVFWAVAAGNEALNHWRGTWSDPDGNGILNFTDSDERMQISSSEEVDIFLNWDQYGDPVTDLDLYVCDRNGTIVGLSEEYQAATGEPAEEISFAYDSSRAPYGIEVVHFSGPTDGLDITIFSFDNEFEHAEPAGSLMDPAPAPGVCAVAAVNRGVWEQADPPQESFSSQGPTTDGRTKPDIAAPDGTTSWSYGVLGSYGTSFSAPVVAGAAALLLESDPSLAADEIHAALTGAAVDVGETGPDNIYGAGKLSLRTLPPLRKVHHVDVDAAGPVHDGTSWETAFLHPQDALDVAGPREDVWVAAGTYARREATDAAVVSIGDGVVLYGGFTGTETKPGERDPEANPTVLDGEGVCTHVAVAASDCRLEGFTVTGGNASGGGHDGYGGGIFIVNASDVTVAECAISSNAANLSGGGLAALNSPDLQVEDCEFTDNSAAGGDGGGAYAQSSSARFERCGFSGNTASAKGGGLHADGFGPHLTECTFEANQAVSAGGGLAVLGATGARVSECGFTGNTVAAGGGGGAYVQGPSAWFRRCAFDENSASGDGGGLYLEGTGPILRDCTFASNRAGSGGAVFNAAGTSADVINCVLTGNQAGQGGAVFNADDSVVALRNCTLTGNAAAPGPESGGGVLNDTLSHTLVANCILWRDRPDEIADLCPASKVSYSLVEGGLEGVGVVRVIDGDPKFVAPGRWDDAGTPGDDSDDAWVEGDYHLQPGSPCIDAAHAEEARGTDIEGNPRSDDGPTPDTGIGGPTFVDIGAYEFPGRARAASGGCVAEGAVPGRADNVVVRAAPASTAAAVARMLWLMLAAALGYPRSARRERDCGPPETVVSRSPRAALARRSGVRRMPGYGTQS